MLTTSQISSGVSGAMQEYFRERALQAIFKLLVVLSPQLSAVGRGWSNQFTIFVTIRH
jgi:hypothetical protein